ncbi:MAG: hypothetical protein LBL79_10460 [Prevotella sp.]|jgi:hypothetical protein|nr:hypothetical protein [Prevotella sp.]
MKTKYSFLFLFLAILSFGIVSCSNDDDNPIVTEEEANIAIDKDLIDIAIEGSASLKITEGNGEYSAFSLNNDVATTSLSGQTIDIQGIGVGKTSIIISDKKTQLKVVPVIVYEYNEIVLEKNELIFDFLLGNEISTRVNILEGNGDYAVVSDNDQIKPSVSGNIITVSTIKGCKGGTANITITDACDRKTVFKVEANATTDPYSEEELADMMGNSSRRYYFNGHTGYSPYGGTKFNTIEKEMNMYGWDYYSIYWLKIYFPGDKSVGEKAGSKITYNYYGEEVLDFADLTTCKVVKNDGTNIWIVYTYLDSNGVLIPGYIVSPV